MALAQVLICASAAIMLLLGCIHLALTFFTNKFHLRDAQLQQQLKQARAYISNETTVWKAWVGFNASHSLGVMLFGAVYVYLAALHADFFFQSYFLGLLGLALLMAYLALAKRYWFSAPLAGIAFATALYLAGLAVAWA
jgi:hypothetical protein